MSEQLNKYENHTPIIYKKNWVTEILIKEKNYFSFLFILVFSHIFVIMFYAADTFLLSL